MRRRMARVERPSRVVSAPSWRKLITNFPEIQYIQSVRQAIVACRLRIGWNMRVTRGVAFNALRARHPYLGRLS